MKFSIPLITGLAMVATLSLRAATLTDWDFSTFQSKGDGVPAAETLLDESLYSNALAGLSSSDLSGGGNIVYSGGGGSPLGELNVKLNSGYIQYTMTADGSNTINLTGLSTNFYRNGNGAPTDYAFEVKVDDGNFEQFGSTIVQPGTGSPYINENVTGDVTGSVIAIRFLRGAGDNSVGNIHLNALSAEGSVIVPEPSTYALIAGLLGLTSVMLRRRK
jgi:hypothetical protein